MAETELCEGMECDNPVQLIGDTCSLGCYTRVYHLLMQYMGDGYVPDGPILNTMASQDWYAEEQEKIQRRAEEHELDPSSPLHQE